MASGSGGNPDAARSTFQRMPEARRSFAVSLIALPIVESFAVGAISVTRATGAVSRATADVPIAITPGTEGASRHCSATAASRFPR